MAFKQRKVQSCMNVCQNAISLVDGLALDAAEFFCCKGVKNFEQHGISRKYIQHQSLCMHVSGFVSDNVEASLQGGLGEMNVFVQKHPYRQSPHVVAKGQCFGNLPRYDNIIVYSDETASRFSSDCYFLASSG